MPMTEPATAVPSPGIQCNMRLRRQREICPPGSLWSAPVLGQHGPAVAGDDSHGGLVTLLMAGW